MRPVTTPRPRLVFPLACVFFFLILTAPASAQIVESVGNRALGMGGAFVAVADDSTATWWNPAGLATGAFADAAAGWSVTGIDGDSPAREEAAFWFSAGVAPLGLSYYHLRITDIGPHRPIEPVDGGREDRRTVQPAWSRSASQLGASLVYTLFAGLQAGTTLKYVQARGAVGDVVAPEPASVDDRFDLAREMSDGDSHHGFDVDAGVMAQLGRVRLGGLVRNILASDLGVVSLPRQVRLGGAVEASTGEAPLTIAVDADALIYDTPYGERRVVAAGAEGWFGNRRVGVRAGARFNTVGLEERAFTAGASVAVWTGVYVDGYIVQGGMRDEGGWGLAARASF